MLGGIERAVGAAILGQQGPGRQRGIGRGGVLGPTLQRDFEVKREAVFEGEIVDDLFVHGAAPVFIGTNGVGAKVKSAVPAGREGGIFPCQQPRFLGR